MVEGGQIDTAAHANDYANMAGETLAFDDAVATALSWAAGHPDTLVIVTADHETGGLALSTNPDGTLSFSFTSTGHTATDVPVKASGPGAARLGGGRILNTQIFDAMFAAMGLGLEAPVASFSTDAAGGQAPLAVRFTDASTGSPTAWAWDFESDGSIDSTEQSPVHTYSAAGTYTASLTVTNSAGSSSAARTITVLPPVPPLDASFTAAPVTGAPPLAVTFTDTSGGSPTKWSWDFEFVKKFGM
jgi:PKD repeat protein